MFFDSPKHDSQDDFDDRDESDFMVHSFNDRDSFKPSKRPEIDISVADEESGKMSLTVSNQSKAPMVAVS